MTEFWRYGPTPLPFSEVGRFARDMESMGWDGLAVGENARQPDPYATLTLAAVATTKLRLGTATVVPTRPPLLHAISMTTTQAVSGGRTRFSIGRGDSAVRSLNQAPMSVARFEAYLRQLQGYLRREDVDIDGAVTTMKGLSAIDPSLAITKPPVDVAASGPKLIDVAIRTADSVTFAVEIGRAHV